MLRDAMPLGLPMTSADIVKAIGIPQIETANVAVQIGAFVESGLLHRETRPKGGGAYQYTRLRNAQDVEPSPTAEKFEKRLIGGVSITLPKMPDLSIDNL
jgi:hypothetical protein